MKYTTFILLAAQLATYAHGKPIPSEGVEPVEQQVEVRDLEFHELQAFFKRAADDAAASAPVAPGIPASENPFVTEELTTDPPPSDLFGRDDAPAAPGIPADENPFKTEELTTDPPPNALFGRDDAPAAAIPASQDPFKTEELSTDPPPSDLFGRAIDAIKHPRNLLRRATGTAKTFDLPQVENPNHQPADGQTAYIKSYGKFSKDLPQGLKDASKTNDKLKQKLVKQIKQTGSVSATAPKDYESEFVIPVQIGTPAQTIYLNLDTGSADFWVFSSDTTKKSAQGHTLYYPKNSSTSKLLPNQSWKIAYADGSGASGIVYTDKVQIGNTQVQSQAIESAQRVSSDFVADTFSNGIVGMAFSNLNTVRPNKQKTFLDNVQSSLQSPVFTADLKKGEPGSYQFGYIDKKAYTGSITYTPATNNNFWQFSPSGYIVGSGSAITTNVPAIVDTGTTLLLVPSNIVKAYYAQVKNAYYDPWEGMYTFPCQQTLPDFTFTVGNYKGTVPGSYINYGNADWKRCYGGIQSSDGLGVAIFGDILLKAQYVVFDIGKKQLGFANKKTT